MREMQLQQDNMCIFLLENGLYFAYNRVMESQAKATHDEELCMEGKEST